MEKKRRYIKILPEKTSHKSTQRAGGNNTVKREELKPYLCSCTFLGPGIEKVPLKETPVISRCSWGSLGAVAGIQVEDV